MRERLGASGGEGSRSSFTVWDVFKMVLHFPV